MIKIKIGKKVPVMEKKKMLQEIEPISMAIGALLTLAFKYLGPLIGKLLVKLGNALQGAQKEVTDALSQSTTIPEEQKQDILEKLNAAEAKLKETLTTVQEQAKSPEAAKAMEKRPSAMVADDVEAYNNVIKEAKTLASKEKAVLEALDKAEKTIADIQKQIRSLDVTAAISSMKDPQGLFKSVPEIGITDETKWVEFASALASGAKSTEATA